MASQTIARKKLLVLPAYPVGQPNANPIISTYRFEKPYPYFMYDSLSDASSEVAYEALVLENEYLELAVVPKLGAKLYYAFDKRNGQHLFYHNRVVKPQLVALTGAWTAGGIEFNFPRAHRPSCMEEIETALRHNADGSGSIFLGEADRTTGIRFSVELRLHPQTARIEEIVRIENPTALPQRFYFWNTASYPETADLTCRYPARWWVEERKRSRRPWPYEGTTDIRKIANFQGFATIFTSRSDSDFFGLYDDKLQRGTVHVADHRHVPGKKLWAWGSADEGAMWNRILTDEDGPYVEFQVGNVQTQFDFTALQPFQTLEWKEYWFQAIATGPFQFANRFAVVGASFQPAGPMQWRLKLSIGVNEKLSQATVKVIQAGHELHAETPELSPSATFQREIALRPGFHAAGDLRLQLSDGDRLLLDEPIYSSRDPVALLEETPELQEDDNTDSLLARLARAEGRQNLQETDGLLEELLRQNPHHIDAYTRKAINHLKMLNARDAKDTMAAALRLAPMSDQARYYMALTEFALGAFRQAGSHLREIPGASAWAHAAGMLSGVTLLAEGAHAKAVHCFASVRDTGPPSAAVDLLLAVSCRKAGQTERAAERIRAIRQRDPLHPIAALEAELLQAEQLPEQPSWLRLVGDNVHNVLQAAAFYDRLGDLPTQREVLTRCGLLSEHPLVLYHLGCLEQRMGRRDEALRLYRLAERQPPDRVFPIESLTLQALDDAIAATGISAGKAMYYRGLILHARERFAEAETAWTRCAEAGMAYSVLYRNLGRLLMKKGETDKAVAVLEAGLPLEPFNSDIRVCLNSLYKKQGLFEKRLSLIPRDTEPDKLDDTFARMAIGIWIDMGDYEPAIRLLTTFPFRIWEIEENRDMSLKKLYEDAWKGKAKLAMTRGEWDSAVADLENALNYTANTQLARAAEQDDSEIWYMLALCHEKRGEFASALRYCDRILRCDAKPETRGYVYYVKAANMKVELEWCGFDEGTDNS